MKRGDLIIVALSGDYGKPRPAIVVQEDAFETLPSVSVLPLTSELRAAGLVRITVEPSRRNALLRRSQVMVDKVVTIPLTKVSRTIGSLEPAAMAQIDFALTRFLGLG